MNSLYIFSFQFCFSIPFNFVLLLVLVNEFEFGSLTTNFVSVNRINTSVVETSTFMEENVFMVHLVVCEVSAHVCRRRTTFQMTTAAQNHVSLL